MVGADGESVSGGIVLTPVSAPRLTASLQPSASAESKSQGEQLAAQMCAPPAPAGAWGCTPTPFQHLPVGTAARLNPAQPRTDREQWCGSDASGPWGGGILVGIRPGCSCLAELQHW